MDISKELRNIADNNELLEIARKAIEDVLVEHRDSRLAVFGRANGLVIREVNGKDSDVIRFGSETAVSIGLKAIANRLDKLTEPSESCIDEALETKFQSRLF